MTKSTRRLTCIYANVLDTLSTMERYWGKRSSNGLLIVILITSVIGLNQSSAFGNPRSSQIGHTYAISQQQIDDYRLYAHNRIFDFNEFICYDKLIVRESQWNPYDVNGSHYGLVQGDSKYLKGKSAFEQIDWSLAYIKVRYRTICKALNHSYSKGWY